MLPSAVKQVRRLLDTKREDINRMPMLLDVSRAFAEVLINYLITEKLDALEARTACPTDNRHSACGRLLPSLYSIIVTSSRSCGFATAHTGIGRRGDMRSLTYLCGNEN